MRMLNNASRPIRNPQRAAQGRTRAFGFERMKSIMILIAAILVMGCASPRSTKSHLSPDPNEDDRVFLLKRLASVVEKQKDPSLIQTERQRLRQEEANLLHSLQACTGVQMTRNGNRYLFTVKIDKDKTEVIDIERSAEPLPQPYR